MHIFNTALLQQALLIIIQLVSEPILAQIASLRTVLRMRCGSIFEKTTFQIPTSALFIRCAFSFPWKVPISQLLNLFVYSRLNGLDCEYLHLTQAMAPGIDL